MILTTTSVDIKYISVCRAYPPIENANLKDYIGLAPLGVTIYNESFKDTYKLWEYRYRNIESPITAKGIYLGDSDDIHNEIISKINPASPNTFKTLYFDKFCKYPRFKVSELTKIKRCTDPSKADSIIISPHKFNTYKGYSSVYTDSSKDALVLFSATNNCYYFIDFLIDYLHNFDQTKKFKILLNNYLGDQILNINTWGQVLINSGILPNDSKKIYYGKVVLLNRDDTEFINNLSTKYMLLTYDTELDKLISNNLQSPTNEDIDTLDKMLSSTDSSIISMGLKLLSNYNLSNFKGSIGIIIANNWNHIKFNPTSRSIGFQQTLDSLGLSIKKLNTFSFEVIINKLYENISNDDRKYVKKVVISKIKNELMSSILSRYEKSFSSLELTFKLIIE